MNRLKIFVLAKDRQDFERILRNLYPHDIISSSNLVDAIKDDFLQVLNIDTQLLRDRTHILISKNVKNDDINITCIYEFIKAKLSLTEIYEHDIIDKNYFMIDIANEKYIQL